MATLPFAPQAETTAGDDTAAGHASPNAVIAPTLPAWLPWLGGRLLSGLATILAISAIVYFATLALPSDPARVILGPEATEAAVALLRDQLGLNRPVLIQYGEWLWRVVRGDFGVSLDSAVPALQIVVNRIENTLALMAAVLAVAVPLSFLLGVAMAIRRDSRFDSIAMTLLIAVKAVPAFAVAVGLIIVLSTTVLPILPAVSLLDPARSPFAQPQFLVLPMLTLALTILPFLTRLVRAGMIETLDAEYIAAARLRGIPEAQVVWRHAVPNTAAPVLQGVAMSTRMLLGGALIVEVVFSYPGIGSALNAAIETRDIPVVQAITLIVAVGVVVINLAADLATVLLTPRLRTSAHPQLRSGAKAKLKLKAGGV